MDQVLVSFPCAGGDRLVLGAEVRSTVKPRWQRDRARSRSGFQPDVPLSGCRKTPVCGTPVQLSKPSRNPGLRGTRARWSTEDKKDFQCLRRLSCRQDSDALNVVDANRSWFATEALSLRLYPGKPTPNSFRDSRPFRDGREYVYLSLPAGVVASIPSVRDTDAISGLDVFQQRHEMRKLRPRL
jgi:hypothetical protein